MTLSSQTPRAGPTMSRQTCVPRGVGGSGGPCLQVAPLLPAVPCRMLCALVHVRCTDSGALLPICQEDRRAAVAGRRGDPAREAASHAGVCSVRTAAFACSRCGSAMGSWGQGGRQGVVVQDVAALQVARQRWRRRRRMLGCYSYMHTLDVHCNACMQ